MVVTMPASLLLLLCTGGQLEVRTAHAASFVAPPGHPSAFANVKGAAGLHPSRGIVPVLTAGIRQGPPTSRLVLSLEPGGAETPAVNTKSALTADASAIESPVLKKVFPDLLQHYEQYGHANIPLGTGPGRACVTLRRLHTEGKLNEMEVQLLQDDLNFTFESLEDVYFRADFDDMLEQLQEYAAQHDGDLSPPKKYPANPQLGAWVTGLRRLYNNQGLAQPPSPGSTASSSSPRTIDPEHVAQLDAIGFSWISPRQCGSKFMLQYRALQERLAAVNGDVNAISAIWKEPEVQQWLQAQRQAYARDKMSETRSLYMERLKGKSDWWKMEDDEATTSAEE